MKRKLQNDILKRWIIVPLGAVFFVVGLILLPLPIPFGLLLMILGLFMMAANPFVMRFLKRTRARFPAMSAKLREVTPHMPGFLAKFLRRTDNQKKRSGHKGDQAS